ncbi:MAG: hypothetical protein HY661_19625 [Betaproteobacteria bacterium]|nr:hypothetical protein [Betaproteobacteria bacterium]
MSRQINLYSPAFRRQAKKFSAVWTISAVVAIAASLFAYYSWETYQLRDLRVRRTEAGAQLKQLREQFVALGKTTQRPKNKALEDQVARAESLLKSRQELFVRLQGGEIGNREGYAKFLTALARQHMDGVWLTGIDISGPGGDFVLEGRTIRADLVPGFIKMLRNEDALRGKSIGTLSLHEREIESKAEQKPPAGSAGAAPAKGAQAEPAAPRPGVRVVEFTIGTEAGKGTGTGPVVDAGTGGTAR